MPKISIDIHKRGPNVDKKLHSQFIEFLGTCITDGIWVGRDSAIPNYDGIRKEAADLLAKLQPPVLRWPGGCYADRYHWRDGVGPCESRPITYNTNFGTQGYESNQFGTHEFMRLCRMVGAEPWLNVNMMSGAVAEMQQWAEYCNRESGTALADERTANGDKAPFNVRYWGIGNESWAGGGCYTPQGYADEYRKYAAAFPSFGHPFDAENPAKPFLIAVGPDGNKPAERVAWTRGFFEALAQFRRPPMQGYDLHFYNWNVSNAQDTVTSFDEAAYYNVLLGCLEIEQVLCEQYDLVQQALAAIPPERAAFGDMPGPECGLIIGEWGNWHRMDKSAPSALWQQCTMRDALTTALTLDIFHRHADKLQMACAAQAVNVLNSVLLTFGERTVATPNYHVFRMYLPHRNAHALDCAVHAPTLAADARGTLPEVAVFASRKNDVVTVNLINPSYGAACEADLDFGAEMEYLGGETLGGGAPQVHNTPQAPNAVCPFAAAAPDRLAGGWRFRLPRASVSVHRFKAE